MQCDLAEMKVLCEYNERTGTSMEGLRNAARAKGLVGVPMKIGIEQMMTFKGPIIASLLGSHFVVVQDHGSNELEITDPPARARIVARADFAKIYSGFALLIAKEASAFPHPHGEGPDLRLDGYYWDFGAVNQSEVPTHTFKCRNVGTTDLEITKVDTSCQDCIVPTGWTQKIPPGGEGEVNILVMTKGQGRNIAKQVYVISNDPISPVVEANVAGYVRPACLSITPRSFSFGTRRRSECPVLDAIVPVFGEDRFSVTSVSCDSPFVKVALVSQRNGALSGYRVRVSLLPGLPVGQFSAKVTILSGYSPQPRAEIPVTATIKGNVDLDRDSFFLGLAKQGKESVANVTISTVSRDPLKIEKIDDPLDCVTVDVKPKTEGKEYILTATLKPDAPLGNIKGDITVHTNDPDQPEIKVPVYAYVEKPA